MSVNTKSPAKATKRTTTKVEVANKSVVVEHKPMSNSMRKLLDTIFSLEAKREKEGLTTNELKRLVNAKMKLEDKTPSAVFNKVTKATGDLAELVNEMLGKSKMPTYKEFITELVSKQKYAYSTWDGLGVLVKFNKVAATKTKVARQNKKEAAK